MLKAKRIVLILSYSVVLALTPFNSLAPKEEVRHINKPIIKKELKVEKPKPQPVNQPVAHPVKQAINEQQWETFTLTFYSSLNCENGYGPITAEGNELAAGGVANDVIPLNTKIYLDGYGQAVVNDRGSTKYFSNPHRLDVFVARQAGESDARYEARVAAMGVVRVKGYIIK